MYLKQDDLFLGFEGLADGLEERPTEVALHVALFVGLSQIDELHFGQGRAAKPLRQDHVGCMA